VYRCTVHGYFAAVNQLTAPPADVLGASYLTTQTLLMSCPLAKAGATIDSWLDEQPLAIASANAARVERLLKARKEVSAQAIRQRGHARLAPGYATRAGGLRRLGNRPVADLERALRLDQNADLKSLEAILLATCPDAKFRDGKKAVAAAELARKLTGDSMNQRPATSLALAYAEACDFGSAVEWQKKVIALVPEDEKPQQREHLRRFEAKQPLQEPSPL
jgi:hypothetical protein